MRDLGLDLRYALRALRGAPMATISAALTLALGVAMSTSIFSVVNGIVLRPLPFAHEDRLINVCEQYAGATSDWCAIAPPTALDVARNVPALAAFGIARNWPFTIDTPNGAEQIAGGLAEPEVFDALGARAAVGRLLDSTDMIGRESVTAVLSNEAWQSRWGARRDIVGRTIVLDGQPVTVVGVLAPGFQPPRLAKVDVWRTPHFDPRDESNREWRGFVGFGRLKQGVSLATARAQIASVARDVKRTHFASVPEWGLRATSTHDLVVGGTRPMLYFFLGAVLVVLLIGCANIANLLLARAQARVRETAIRAALGASPSRIARELMVESGVLALLGGTLGVMLAVGATRTFRALAPSTIPRVSEVGIDARVLLFALGVTALTAVLFGLVPALRGARVDLARVMGDGGRGSSPAGRLGDALVVGELALAVALVASAGLLVRSFAAFESWRPGFEQEHLTTLSTFAPTSKYSKPAAVAALWKRLEVELASVPGVSSVATASAGPLFGGRETWELDASLPAATPRATVRWMDASPGYFSTFGVPIVRGRALSEDDIENGPLVGVINEATARLFWPGHDPIGKTLTFAKGSDRAVFRIVGVSRDTPPLRPGDAVEPQLVWSNRQIPRPFTYFIVRTSLDPSSLATVLAARVKSVDRDLEARDVHTMGDLMRGALVTPRFTMVLVVVFGVAALAFAGIGTFGLLSYLVSRRTREIGIRYALGAQRLDIVIGVVRRGVTLAGIGAVIGIAATVAAGGFIRSLVAGVSVVDLPSLLAAPAILIGVGVAACLVPALRASRVDPITTLGAD